MDKSYSPRDIETAHLRPLGRRPAGSRRRATGEPYCIVIPPPNVTGTLHMGHAFQHTLMDALIRFHRMDGGSTLWQPGTDHAGIATQMVVERQLNAEGRVARGHRPRGVRRARLAMEGAVRRHDRAADAPARRTRSTGRATASRWTRTCRRAVTEVFVRLHEDGLIYRGQRLVNWDPVLHTALSDLEVQCRARGRPACGTCAIRSPTAAVTSSSRRRVPRRCSATPRSPCIRTTSAIGIWSVATSELPLDGAPDPGHRRRVRRPGVRQRLRQDHAGTRLQRLRGRSAPRPAADQHLHGRRGAQRRGAAGVSRSRPVRGARARRGRSRGAGAAREDRAAHGCRCRAAIAAARCSSRGSPTSGTCASRRSRSPRSRRSTTDASASCPRTGRSTYFQWMRNIQDWCISRQLWWGHRIPAWYDADGNIFVARDAAAAAQAARAQLGREVALRQDDDVLDTWFSSALWPFSTLGWPAATPELANVLSDVGAGDRFRHHLLLGRADDHDGARVRGRRAVPRRLHHRADPRRARPEDVEVQGQHHRPARPDRRHRPRGARRQAHDRAHAAADEDGDREGDPQAVPAGHSVVRHRCAALHVCRARDDGSRHPLRPRAHRRLSQLLQQALECRAFRADEHRGAIPRRPPGRRARALRTAGYARASDS